MIIHLDADAFFASVEQAADPKLRGRPVAVGGEKRGIIAAASYEARKMGVYTPMPTVRAKKLCPKLIVLPGDFDKYERFSRLMFSYAYDFTPMVEVGSIDEGYFDLGGNRKAGPRETAETIRKAIAQNLKLPVSEGIGRSKLIAQIASKLRKPRSFIEVPGGTEYGFLEPLPNKWLPGVGPKLASVLNAAGLARIGQIARTDPEMLGLFCGNGARQLWQFANAIDERPVVPDPPAAKSYGAQETFAEDSCDETFVLAMLRSLTDQLMGKVREDTKAIRTVTVRIRYNDMLEVQRAESLEEPTALETDVYPMLPRLLKKAWERRASLRLVAVKLSHIYNQVFQADLELDPYARTLDGRQKLAATIDEVRGRYGRDAIMRGHDLWLREQGVRRRRSQAKPAPQPEEKKELVLRWGQLVEKKSAYVAPVQVEGAPRLAESPEAHAVPAPRHSPGTDKSWLKQRMEAHRTLRQRPGMQGPELLVPRETAVGAGFPLLNFKSYYHFLDSLLSPQRIVEMAVEWGASAVALTDPNLHGAVEFYQLARDAGIQPVIGATVRTSDTGKRFFAYVEDQAGYGKLCRMLSMVEGPTEAMLMDSRAGLFLTSADRPTLALPEVRYREAKDRLAYDIVQSIRTLTRLRQGHAEKRSGTHWYLPKPAEFDARYERETIRATREIAERCTFEFDLGGLRFPGYTPADGSSPRLFLERLAWTGLRERYSQVTPQLEGQLRTELGIIAEVGYEEYFLLVWDFLQECHAQGIPWITRGSAADSLVCYCLGISDCCPVRFELYFKRFLNRDRMALNKLPDIDIDFPHDRKDDVVDLIFARYPEGQCAVVGGFSTFQARSAVAEIAKVLGVAETQIRRMTEYLPRTKAAHVEEAIQFSAEARDQPWEEEPYRTAVKLAGMLDGFPRYPKMHPCGLVLSREPIHDLTPTFVSQKGYATTHFDMDSVEAVGLIKLDILAQGGLAVIRDTTAALAARGIEVELSNRGPWEDGEVWEMIASGRARGVHHIESPAMCSLARMCDCRDIDRLIAMVSVIRPGAANNTKKAVFGRRASGLEPVEYPHPSLEGVLRTTFGVVAYEEHILQVCEAFAGMDAGRADLLRRALVKLQREKIAELGTEFVESARRQGRNDEEIARVWELVCGFQGYAFCRAHSTAYGLEAYQAGILKRYYPADFLAAVLSNGKGFYSRLVYTLEARLWGVGFRSPDVNASRVGFYAVREAGEPVIRVPLGVIQDLSEAMLERWEAERGHGAFASLRDFHLRVRPEPSELQGMIRAGAFDGFGETRTAQFWEAHRLVQWTRGRDQGELFAIDPRGSDPLPEVPLTEPGLQDRLAAEWELLGFTVSGHPLDRFPEVAWETYCPIDQLGRFPGETVTVCGMIIADRLHTQMNGETMKFISICDYTGMIETELFADAYKQFGLNTVRYPVVEVTGRVEMFDNGKGYTLRVLRTGKPRGHPD